MVKKRRLNLTVEEDIEFRELLEAGTLNPIAEHYSVTYLEAYHIHKGKIMPSYAVDDASLSRWIP